MTDPTIPQARATLAAKLAAPGTKSMSVPRSLGRTLLKACDIALAPPPVVLPPQPPADAPLPSLSLPGEVLCDPSAGVVHVPVTLSSEPVTTARALVLGTGGLDFEGYVTFPSGGPATVSVAVPLPLGAKDGDTYSFGVPRYENTAVQPGSPWTKIRLLAGAVNAPVAAVLPQRTAQKGALVYRMDPETVRASETGGEGICRDRFVHGRTQPANGEVGYYDQQAWIAASGHLVLSCGQYWEPEVIDGQTFKYWASVLQWNWLAQTYGYYEAEIMTPSAQGTWPAFWLLSGDEFWPPEIDIMEQFHGKGFNPAETTGNNIWADHRIGFAADMSRLLGRPVDTTSEFHVYGLDWRGDFTTWFFDGVEVFRTPTRFHKPGYPLLTVAVGGWAGEPDFSTGTTEMRVRRLEVYA